MGVLNLSESNHKARNSELTLNDIDHLPKEYEEATGFQWPVSDIILRGLPENSTVKYCFPLFKERGHQVTILKRNWDDMVVHRRRGF